MYPIDFFYAVMMEVERQGQRRLQRENLRQSAGGLRQTGYRFGQKIVYWLGTQMIAWGSKLQNINTVSPSRLSQ